MKKLSIILIAICVVASVFLVSFLGSASRTDHFENYIKTIEILTFDKIKASTNQKYKNCEFKEGESNFIAINFKIEMEGGGSVTDDRYEFIITGGNKTFEEEGETYNYAEMQKNILVVYRPCAVTVTLRASENDGTGRMDSCQYIWKKVNN